MKSVEYFIAKRVIQQKTGAFAKTASRLAIISIGVGIFVLILAFSILGGFQETVRNKVFSFDAHIQVFKYNTKSSIDGEPHPVSTNSKFYQNYKDIQGVQSVHSIGYLKGILHANSQVTGVVIKGYGEDFQSIFFDENLIEGRFIQFSDSVLYTKEVVLSERMANQMKVKLNDFVKFYFFIKGDLRPRKLKVVGIYRTGLEDFDNRMVLADLGMIQRMNKWNDTLVGGFEVFVDDYAQLDVIAEDVFFSLDYNLAQQKITDKYLYLFDWLTLLNQNVNIFMIMIFVIAFFNVIATMYILIMERTQMIGLLKAFGSKDKTIRKIFFYMGVQLLFKGMLWGNITGLGFCALQYYLKVIPLDPQNYYMEAVPIQWNWGIFITINICTLVLISGILLIPIIRIAKIAPIKSIKFS